MIKLILITNDPIFAQKAETAGVDRIFVDLEQRGKKARQGHLDTLISSHDFDDIGPVKMVLERAELIVRLNPLYAGSKREIDITLDRGADILMLPMFRSAAEVAEFIALVDGRVGVIPLVETRDAVEALDAIIALPGITEVYIGLNDLHLDLGLHFMFQPLADGLIDHMADTIKQAGLAFGFGGVARVGEGIIPGEIVLAEHARLGSNSVILSRTFNRGLPTDNGSAFAEELQKLKSAYTRALSRTPVQIEQDSDQLKCAVDDFVKSRNDETPA